MFTGSTLRVRLNCQINSRREQLIRQFSATCGVVIVFHLLFHLPLSCRSSSLLSRLVFSSLLSSLLSRLVFHLLSRLVLSCLLFSVSVPVCCVVVVVVAVRHGVCAVWCGVTRGKTPCVHSTRPRVYVQDVPVCTGTTRTHVSTCARGTGRHTRGRFERTHGDVLSGHTERREGGEGSSSASCFSSVKPVIFDIF